MADLAQQVGIYHKDGTDPCNCVSYITLTAHSGVPGTLTFGDGFLSIDDIRDANQEVNSVRQQIGQRQLQQQADFLAAVGSYLCTGATVDFVQCQSGAGPEGEELKKYLESILPAGTEIVLYENNVKWVYGKPQELGCKKTKLK